MMEKVKIIITDYPNEEVHILDYPYGIEGHDKIHEFFKELNNGKKITSPLGECDYALFESPTIIIYNEDNKKILGRKIRNWLDKCFKRHSKRSLHGEVIEFSE